MSSKRTSPPKLSSEFCLEPLESRVLMSVALIGVPDWLDQGPEPILDAGSNIVLSGKAGVGFALVTMPGPGKELVAFSLTLPMTRTAVAELDAGFVAFGRMAIAGAIAAGVLLVTRAPRPAL